MHTATLLSIPNQRASYRLEWSCQSVYLLSHRQGRCIALPVPVLPFVLHEVEGESIECQALFTFMGLTGIEPVTNLL